MSSPERERAERERWNLLAMLFGYNELAKQVRTLGEKVWCRLFRNEAERLYRELGGEISTDRDATILTISSTPRVDFTEKDLALMREAVGVPALEAAAYRRGLERAAGACGKCRGRGYLETSPLASLDGGREQIPCTACTHIRALLGEP